jgi:hypothetical protein
VSNALARPYSNITSTNAAPAASLSPSPQTKGHTRLDFLESTLHIMVHTRMSCLLRYLLQSLNLGSTSRKNNNGAIERGMDSHGHGPYPWTMAILVSSRIMLPYGHHISGISSWGSSTTTSCTCWWHGGRHLIVGGKVEGGHRPVRSGNLGGYCSFKYSSSLRVSTRRDM